MTEPAAAQPSAAESAALSELAGLVDQGARTLNIPDDARILLAVSGGADSMALMHGAAQLLESGRLQWMLSVAHLDHALRRESADDAAVVADAARSLGLACDVRRTDVADLARTEGRSIEDAARVARYAFFEDVAPEGHLIATAHTADDSAETVVLNLLRGAGLSGVRGIPARRGRIVRPLLGVRRATLRALLDAADIAYRDDPSNADPAFLRNGVRAQAMPMLEALRPGAIERIGDFARLAADDDALLDRLAGTELSRRLTEDGAVDWRDPPEAALGRRILRLAIGHPAPSAERVEALMDAAAGDRGGVSIELGGGRTATVRDRLVRIDR